MTDDKCSSFLSVPVSYFTSKRKLMSCFLEVSDLRARQVLTNVSGIFLSSLQSCTYLTVNVNVQVLSPIRRFDIEGRVALIKIFPIQKLKTIRVSHQ